jgi:hypothetical protein
MYTLHHIRVLLGDEIMEDGMGGLCSMNKERDMRIKIFSWETWR